MNPLKRLLVGSIGIVLSILRVDATHSADMRISSNGNLFVIGPIVSGDFERFKTALRLGGPDIGFIELRSPGGSVFESIQIGRLVRSLYMNTNAPWSAQSGSAQPYCARNDRQVLNVNTPCLCASACFNIWAAGVFRYGDEVHIHRIVFEKDFYGSLSPAEASRRYEEGMQIVRSYLQEIGVSDKYYDRMRRISSASSEKIDYFEANRDFGFVPVPGIEEWFIARCGSYVGLHGPAAGRIAECYLREQKKCPERSDEEIPCTVGRISLTASQMSSVIPTGKGAATRASRERFDECIDQA